MQRMNHLVTIIDEAIEHYKLQEYLNDNNYDKNDKTGEKPVKRPKLRGSRHSKTIVQ